MNIQIIGESDSFYKTLCRGALLSKRSNLPGYSSAAQA